MASGTFLPPGLSRSIVKIESGGTNNYVMTAVDGETIQGEDKLTFDGNDLTVATDVGIIFSDSGQKIESDGTDFTIASGAKLNLTPTSDVHIANGTGMVIGHTAQVADMGGSEITPELQVLGTADSDSSITIGNFSTGSRPRLIFVRSKNTSIGGKTIVATDDSLGMIVFAGDDGVDYQMSGVRIEAFADTGTQSTSSMPGRLTFSTTADTASSVTERMRIHATGEIDFKANALGITNVGNAGNNWTATSLDIASANAGGSNSIILKNTSDASSNNRCELRLGVDEDSTGDPKVTWQIIAGSSLYWSMGIDNSDSDTLKISRGATLGTTDAMRITTSGTTTLDDQGSDFDYVCDGCGKSSIEMFACCGLVEWHDDVLALRTMRLSEQGIDHMAKLGVLEIDGPDDSDPGWTGINFQKAMHFTWAGMYQNRERMDAQNEAMDERLKRIEQALGV